MKKSMPGLLLCLCVCACQSGKETLLQNKVDSLEKQISNTYKPGFGEFMSSIQVHHAKLWFAGNQQNWQLADFEIHEIMESLDAIKKYETDRPESGKISMLDPALDRINQAILQKDTAAFNNSFVFLTNTCNHCHQAVNFAFNVVKIPESPPFTNQQFHP